MSSFGTRCGRASMIVTSEPKERHTLANSTPITPPPRTRTRSGMTSSASACSLVRIRPPMSRREVNDCTSLSRAPHRAPTYTSSPTLTAAIGVQPAETGDGGDAAGLHEAFEALELLCDDALAVCPDTSWIDALQRRGDATEAASRTCSATSAACSSALVGCSRGAGRCRRPCPSLTSATDLPSSLARRAAA